MARSVGSLSTTEAKDMAKELEVLTGLPYKQNLDYLRFIEMLISYRLSEQLLSCDNKLKKTCSVEIPLIGVLTITPKIFHKNHHLTDKFSLHFDFKFTPTSAFKKSILTAYQTGECELPLEFSKKYGQYLSDVYEDKA